MYLAENARLGSMKLKLNIGNVANGETFMRFLKYMKHLGTCRDLFIEEYDGSYLDTLLNYIPPHISNVHIRFAMNFFFFREYLKDTNEYGLNLYSYKYQPRIE
jgi:hypothetical protein